MHYQQFQVDTVQGYPAYFFKLCNTKMFKHEIHNYVVHKRFNRLYSKCFGAADDGYLNFYVNLMCVTYAQ